MSKDQQPASPPPGGPGESSGGASPWQPPAQPQIPEGATEQMRQWAPGGGAAPQNQFPPSGQFPAQGQPPAQGQFPQGQAPQGQFPQGQFSQGQAPQGGQFPQGQEPQGQMPPQGQFPNTGQFPPAQGQFPNTGQFPPAQGQFPNTGQFPPAQGQFPNTGQLPAQGQSSESGQFPAQGQFPNTGQFPAAGGFGGPPPPDGPDGPPPGFVPPADGPKAKSRKVLLGGIGAGIAAILAIVLVVVFVWHPWRDDSGGGSSSPANAAIDMLGHLQSRDLAALADGFAPNEVGGLTRLVTDLRDKAKDAGVQDGGGANGLFDGLEFKTKDIKTSSQEIRDDLAKVTLTGGTITVSADPNKLNKGLKDLIGPDATAESHTYDVSDLTGRSNDDKPIPPFVMTTKVNGSWYISPVYTALEYANEIQGTQRTDKPTLKTQQFSTPEDAAKGMLETAVKAVQSADPLEFATALPTSLGTAMATYRDLFTHEIDTSSTEDISLQVDKAEFSSKVSGDVATLTADHVIVSGHDENGSVRVEIEGDCVTTTEDGHRERHCAQELSRDGFSLNAIPKLTAVKDGNGWHVDPLATVVRATNDWVSTLDKDQLIATLGLNSFPQLLAKAPTQGTVSASSSQRVTLKNPSESTKSRRGFAVLDLDADKNKSITVTVTGSTSYPTIIAAGDDGIIDSRYKSTSGSRTYARQFTTPSSGSVKIIVIGRTGDSLTVSVK